MSKGNILRYNKLCIWALAREYFRKYAPETWIGSGFGVCNGSVTEAILSLLISHHLFSRLGLERFQFQLQDAHDCEGRKMEFSPPHPANLQGKQQALISYMCRLLNANHSCKTGPRLIKNKMFQVFTSQLDSSTTCNSSTVSLMSVRTFVTWFWFLSLFLNTNSFMEYLFFTHFQPKFVGYLIHVW